MNRSPRIPGSISGRVFTTLFALGLVAALIVGVPIVLRFDRLQSQIDALRQRWPDAAASLDTHYRSIDQWSASNTQLPAEFKKGWEAGRSEFAASPLHELQIGSVLELEGLLKNEDIQKLWSEEAQLKESRDTMEQAPTIQRFLEVQKELAELEDDRLGIACRSLLRLKATPRWIP